MANNTEQHGQVVGKPPVPESAPLTKPALSTEERKQRFAELRERLKVSRLSTQSLDGSKTGYWARKNDEGELGRLDYLGFSIVHDDAKKPRWKASGLRLDGTYQVADLILLEIDTEMYQFLLDENQERSKAQIIGATESFKHEAAMTKERTGYDVPTFDRSK